MLTLQSAQDITNLLTRLLAYLLIITPAGSFRSWFTKKMGDSTANNLGLSSLNPLIHIDIFGIVCLVLFGFGWGKQITLNPNNIHGKLRTIKLTLASFSGVFIYLSQAVLYLILLALLFGSDLQILGSEQVTSFWLVIGRILIASIGLCSFLAVVELILNGILLILIFISEKQYYQPYQLWYILLIAAFIILVLIGQPLQELLMRGILQTADFIAQLTGIT